MKLLSNLPIDKNILTLALYRIYTEFNIQAVCINDSLGVPFRSRCFPTSETVGLTIFIAVDWGLAKSAIV